MRRTVCFAVLGLVIMVNSCRGQAPDDSLPVDSVSQDDSLLYRTIAPNVSALVDTAHRNDTLTADSMRAQADSGVSDFITPAPQPQPKPAPNEEPVKESAKAFVKAPAVLNLSPFSSDRVHAWGASLDYFSYAELNDYFPLNYAPFQIQGAPKSTEYGLMFGLNYEGALRRHGSMLLLRPKLEVEFGIHQTYDGSTQALPIINDQGDTIGFRFLPVKIYKSNYFVRAGLDAGYCRTRALVPYYLYSGIKAGLWYRDMVADTTSYSNQITNSELYYWFSLPVGLAFSVPLSPTLAAGLDASCDLMFFGQMKAYLSAWDPESTWTTVSPAVTLGNRTGYRLELSLTYKTAEGTVFKFAPYFALYAFGRSENEISKSYANGVYTGQGNDMVFYEPSSTSWLLGVKFQIVFLSPRTRTL
ncbi:MAG: hypothetical protein PHC61_07690 [Chitinivibrionales bacterium]|nr:hypothetical protein [Chitinivibrionales bacterium]